MTTGHDFSEEILLMIFKDLGLEDLRNCQQVCRSWYLPAQTLTLRNVDLKNLNEIERFITFIDDNPKQLYLNAVKKMTIRDLDITASKNPIEKNNEQLTLTDNEGFSIKVETVDEVKYSPPLWHSKVNLKKLITRFPNLQEIHIIDSLDFLQEFDDELCESILTNCPKLNIFDLSAKNHKEAQTQYCDALHKVRLLVTTISMEKLTDVSRFGSATQFLTSFPRLTQISSPPVQLDTFNKWLPVIEHLPNLTDLSILTTEDDQRSFAKEYLTAKTKDEQDQLREKLSAIKQLSWFNGQGVCLNSLKFISNFMGGLQSLTVNCIFKEQWSNLYQRLFCNIALDLLECIATCTFSLTMKIDEISEYLPIIINSTFFQAERRSNDLHRILQVRVVDNAPSLEGTAQVMIHANKTRRRSIRIVINDNYTLDKIASGLLGKSLPSEELDEFQLVFKNRRKYKKKKVDAETYFAIFKEMPSVKRLVLDIPFSYVDTGKTFEDNEELVSVEELAVLSDVKTNFQALLDSYCSVLPNLRSLRFSQFCGVWNESFGEFQINLPRYTLKSLGICLHTAYLKTHQHLQKENIKEGDFMVVLVEMLDTSERLLYKVSLFDWSTTPIIDKDLKGFVRGKDYLRVYITLRSLQKLMLTIYNMKTKTFNTRSLNLIDNNNA